MEKYIERRRGTLRKYLEEHRRDLFLKAIQTGTPSRNVNKNIVVETKMHHKRRNGRKNKLLEGEETNNNKLHRWYVTNSILIS